MNYVSFVSMNCACMVGWHYRNMYGWMHVCGTCYVWLMELCMYDEIICVGYLMFAVNLPCEKYICIIYLLWKWLGIRKKRKKRGNAGSLPSATDGNGLFAVRGGRQRSHVATTCASWQLTHLVSLPTVADGKSLMLFVVSGGRQRLPLDA